MFGYNNMHLGGLMLAFALALGACQQAEQRLGTKNEAGFYGKPHSVRESITQYQDPSTAEEQGKLIYLVEKTTDFDTLGRAMTVVEENSVLEPLPLPSKAKLRLQYHYDDEGRKQMIATYQGDSLMQTQYFYYNALGQLVQERKEMGKDLSHTQYIYDDKGRLSSTRQLERDSIVVLQEDRRYDAEGRLAEVLINNILGEAKHSTNISYAYDAEGRLIEKVLGDSRELCTYNEQGELATEKRYLANNLVLSCTYEYRYDQQGNWTHRVTYCQKYQAPRYKAVEHSREIVYC